MSVSAGELQFPANLEAEAVTAFLRSLAARRGPSAWKQSETIVFETAATSGMIRWQVTTHPKHRQLLASQLRAHLADVSVSPEPAPAPSRTAGVEFALELRLTDLTRPLRTDVAAELSASLLAVMSELSPSESIRLVWTLGPPLPRKHVVATKTGKRDLLDRLLTTPPVDAHAASRRNDKQSEPIFGLLGQVAVRACHEARAKSLAASVVGALQLASQASVRFSVRRLSSAAVLRRMRSGQTPRLDWPVVLNAVELTSLLGWPIGGPIVSGVNYSGKRQLPFPESALLGPASSAGHHRVLGESDYPSRSGLVQLQATDALQHLHVIGPTGVGKSTLLANLALADIAAGRGVVVIEPKGDLVADIVDRIPESRRNDVVLLDPSDTSRPVGLPLLSGGRGRVEVEVDQIVHLFRTMFASSWGPRTQDILHASLLTLAQTPGMTMVELPELLTNAQFRRRLVEDANQLHGVASFWAWFDALSSAERNQVIAPVLNKLRAFTMRSHIRLIIGQSSPGFRISELFTKRRILLVPLRRGAIGAGTANLLAGLIVSQLWQATQARSQMNSSRRHPVMAYLDEFQSYLNLPTDLGDMLAEARSLGLGLTLAHQNLGQLNRPELKAAVLANARSRVVFQAGAEDAVPLAKSLGQPLTPSDLLALGAYEAYGRIMVAGTSMSPGSLRTLPLPPSLGSARSVRELSAATYGRAASEIEAGMRSRTTSQAQSKAGGRRRRAS